MTLLVRRMEGLSTKACDGGEDDLLVTNIIHTNGTQVRFPTEQLVDGSSFHADRNPMESEMDIPEDDPLFPRLDAVHAASDDSFPASDPPSWTIVMGIGEPARHPIWTGSFPWPECQS